MEYQRLKSQSRDMAMFMLVTPARQIGYTKLFKKKIYIYNLSPHQTS